MMSDIETAVKTVISRQLGIPLFEVDNHKKFTEDLGADSLDTVALLVALEEKLDIEISDEEAVKIKTVQDAINFTKKALSIA